MDRRCQGQRWRAGDGRRIFWKECWGKAQRLICFHRMTRNCCRAVLRATKTCGSCVLIRIGSGTGGTAETRLPRLFPAVLRGAAHGRLCDLLLQRHRESAYDCVFQLSQTELFKLGRHLHELPPVVVYPCVHAAGELRWHARESAYALQSEPTAMHYLVRGYLMFRSLLQRREMQKPAMILGMSRRFNQLIEADYAVPRQRLQVLYHPIPSAGEPLPPTGPSSNGPLRLLYIARISVRKGVEQIVELSRRLDDLSGQVQIQVIGDRTQWSDYRKHLKSLNPRTAEYLGGLSHEKTMAAYDTADMLLLPSHYEPGGIVVGEALSRGVPVVVSDAVGSAELIDADCCRSFPAGDTGAFEREVRRLIEDLKNRRAQIRETAWREAERHFNSTKIAADMMRHLQLLLGRFQ